MAGDKNKWFLEAELAKQSGRFQEMATAMRQIAVHFPDGFNHQDRKLLAESYKAIYERRRVAVDNLIDYRRVNYRRLTQNQTNLITAYKHEIIQEMDDVCNDVIHILDTYLIPAATCDEANIFFLALKGDYVRYLTETRPAAERPGLVARARVAYEIAYEIATAARPRLDVVRLVVALNYSVFLNDVENDPDRACALARQTLSEADDAREMGELAADRNTSDHIVMKIRDNLFYWMTDIQRLRRVQLGGGDFVQ